MSRASAVFVLVSALILASHATSPTLVAQAPAAQPQALTYALADRAMQAAEAMARKNKWNVTIVIVDAAGVPMNVRRLDGASARSYDVATRKAATVVATKMATSEYGKRLQAKEVQEVPNGVNFPGGVPIMRGTEFIGAIGTSGVAAADDERISNAGAEAIR
jgi:glc operon protein GlcG